MYIDDDVLFKVFEGCNHNSSGLWEAAERAIRDYFQLEISLSNLYDEWSARDKYEKSGGRLQHIIY